MRSISSIRILLGISILNTHLQELHHRVSDKLSKHVAWLQVSILSVLVFDSAQAKTKQELANVDSSLNNKRLSQVLGQKDIVTHGCSCWTMSSRASPFVTCISESFWNTVVNGSLNSQ